MDERWDSPHNSKLAKQIPEFYQCPSFVNFHDHHGLLTAHKKCMTNYAAVVHPDAIFQGTKSTRYKDITDGTSNAVMVFEVRQHSVHWMKPRDVSLNEVLFDLRSTDDPEQANHRVAIRKSCRHSLRTNPGLCLTNH